MNINLLHIDMFYATSLKVMLSIKLFPNTTQIQGSREDLLQDFFTYRTKRKTYFMSFK